MRRVLSFVLPLLLSAGALAQEGAPAQVTGEASFNGIPLPLGAEPAEVPRRYVLPSGTLEEAVADYRARLEARGFTVTELSGDEDRQLLEVSGGSARATVAFERGRAERLEAHIEIVPGR
jgi:hypothetical protein